MGSNDVKPEEFGRRLYPNIIDQRARSTPNRTFAMIPRTKSLDDGWRELSYEQLAKAINKMSWWLDQQLGVSEPFSTFAYMGASDLRYAFMVVAAMKTQRVAFFPLFTNSKEAHVNLVEIAKCQTVFASSDSMALWDPIRAEMPQVKVVKMPDIEFWLDIETVEHYSYLKTWEEAKYDKVFFLQSSGTTGLPKLIKFTNQMAGALDRERAMSRNVPGSRVSWDVLRDQRVLSTLPASWSFGLINVLSVPLSFDNICYLLPADKPNPLTPSYISRALQLSKAEVMITIPDTLVQISKSPTDLSILKSQLKFILYGGAPLDHSTGAMYSQHVRIVPIHGTTEGLSSIICVPEVPEEWMYYQWHPMSGVNFVPFKDDLFELVITKHEEEQWVQNIFHHFTGISEYRSNDLFRQHPTRKGVWLSAGRVDDFVKLASLTKFHSLDAETIVARHPMVKSVLMGGEGRNSPFMLLELVRSEQDGDVTSIEDIWPAVEEVNRTLATEIRLRKELIKITKPEKPIVRTAKMGVNRRATLMAYKEEIEEMYARDESFPVVNTYHG